MADEDGILGDPAPPGFGDKLVDFLSALVLVALTILTAWNYSLPVPRSQRAAPADAGDNPKMHYPAIPGPAFGQEPAAGILPPRRRPPPVQGR